jgi:neopullulanase
MILIYLLTACCKNTPEPILSEPNLGNLDPNETYSIPLTEIVIDSTLQEFELDFAVASSDPGIYVSVEHGKLKLSAEKDYDGTSEISLTVFDTCDTQTTLNFDVSFGVGTINEEECAQKFSYTAQNNPRSVYVAGSFNDWNAQSHQLTEVSDGVFEGEFVLPIGGHSYKFVEELGDGTQMWNCDPEVEMYQCDDGQFFRDECVSGMASCNSLVHIPETCNSDEIVVDSLQVTSTRISGGIIIPSVLEDAVLRWDGSAVTTDDSEITVSYDEDANQTLVEFDYNNLGEGRHKFEIEGRNHRDVLINYYLPLWNDNFDWKEAVMYFVFVDRFYNGDSDNDFSQGSNSEMADYLGGDWRGVIEKLDYLEDLGVDALWLTSPQSNPEGLYEGKCDMDITGYHGYWPEHPTKLEEQFGDKSALLELIDKAHKRDIRVLFDWVGNHIFEEHPYATEHPEWLTSFHLCDENDNWNQAPETCWFAPYIPTISYYKPEPIGQMVEDAITFAKEYDLDGYRVDAVKHIPYAVHRNFQTQVSKRIENEHFDFYTVGETFSGDASLLNSYIGETMLDGQFDFDLYWNILGAFGRNEIPLYEVEEAYQRNTLIYGEAKMSHFLGNHDVERFISHADGDVVSLYGDGLCPNGYSRGPAESPLIQDPYDSLKLAWTYLMFTDGPVLIYYGDEIGLPGYHDPDNRHMMKFDNQLSVYEEDILDHVQKLTKIRKEHRIHFFGERSIWWGTPDDDMLAIANSTFSGGSIIIMNRSYEDQTIQNTLEWSGLPNSSSYIDELTGEEFVPSDDLLSITIPARSSRVLVWNP